jgi:hypothetical protein
LLAEAGEDLTLKVLVHALLRQQLTDALLTLAHSPVDVEQLLHHLLRFQHGIGTAVAAAGCFARLHVVRDGGLEVIALFRVVFFCLLTTAAVVVLFPARRATAAPRAGRALVAARELRSRGETRGVPRSHTHVLLRLLRASQIIAGAASHV